MFGANPEMSICGLALAGIGIYIYFSLFFGKNKQFATVKQFIAATIFTLMGVLFSIATYFDNTGLMLFSFTVSIGCGFVSYGIFDFLLNKTCTHKITATYLYSRPAGKRGEYSLPVFRYSYEGEEYIYVSQQQISSRFIGSKYRIDQPCQIFINPNKPKLNTVHFEKTKDIVGRILIGLAFIAGGVCALLFM